MKTLQVDVYTMGGRELSLEMASDSTVFELKLQVAKHWSVGQEAQELSSDMKVLNNSQVLADVTNEAHAPLQVSLLTKKNVVSSSKLAQFEDLVAGFESRHSQERLGALRNLKVLADLHDPAEMASLMDIIASKAMDKDHRATATTRQFALHALADLAVNDGVMNQDSARNLTKCLEDDDELVRLTAAEVLPRLCRTCHERTLAELRRLMKNRKAAVRCAAVMAFPEIAKQNELCKTATPSEEAAQRQQDDIDEFLRSKSSRQDDIERLNRLFEKDEDPSVREAALHALSILV